MSDHLPQFFILPEFQQKLFVEDFHEVNWNQIIRLNQNNVNLTFDNYLNTVNTLSKETFNKNHESHTVCKTRFIRRIDSLKSILDAITKIIKRYCMMSIRYIETIYQR